MQHAESGQKRQRRSANRVGEDIAVRRQNVLGSNEGQERGKDVLKLLHVEVSPLHATFVDAVGCAA